VIILSAALGHLLVELSDKESSAVCLVLGIDDIDLSKMFVTLIREDLTSELPTSYQSTVTGGDPDQEGLPF